LERSYRVAGIRSRCEVKVTERFEAERVKRHRRPVGGHAMNLLVVCRAIGAAIAVGIRLKWKVTFSLRLLGEKHADLETEKRYLWNKKGGAAK
jgi:hypothetical protein